jgi:hypothetical protein
MILSDHPHSDAETGMSEEPKAAKKADGVNIGKHGISFDDSGKPFLEPESPPQTDLVVPQNLTAPSVLTQPPEQLSQLLLADWPQNELHIKDGSSSRKRSDSSQAERNAIAKKLERARLQTESITDDARRVAEATKNEAQLNDASGIASSPDSAKDSAYVAKPGVEDGVSHRRSRFLTSLTAFQYISSLSKDDDVRIRDSDRITSLCLLLAVVFTGVTLFLPQLAAHRFICVLGCDGLVGVMLLLYVVNRFGILNTLKPRHALLVWQLIMGAAFIGMFIAINLGIVIALLVMQAGVPGIH